MVDPDKCWFCQVESVTKPIVWAVRVDEPPVCYGCWHNIILPRDSVLTQKVASLPKKWRNLNE